MSKFKCTRTHTHSVWPTPKVKGTGRGSGKERWMDYALALSTPEQAESPDKWPRMNCLWTTGNRKIDTSCRRRGRESWSIRVIHFGTSHPFPWPSFSPFSRTFSPTLPPFPLGVSACKCKLIKSSSPRMLSARCVFKGLESHQWMPEILPQI